jgi:TonB family protein
VGFFELRHTAGARNLTCVSFATTDFVKDGRGLSVTGTYVRDEVFLREFQTSETMKFNPEDTINIDYSDLQPGDEAPDPLAPPKPSRAATPPAAPATAAKPAAHAAASATTNAPAGPGAVAAGCANVIVLSADPTLIDLLRESLTGTHRIWRADDATHAADLMVAAGNAVLLVDSSLADHDTRGLVNEVHKQFPDLPIIVAGRRDDEAELAPLVSSGVIFRFLHKPASAERIRNFVDATQRRAKPATDLPAAAPRQAVALAAAMTAITAEHPTLTLPKVKVDHDWIRRWSRRSLLLAPLLLLAWGLFEWQPWTKGSDGLPTAGDTPVATTDAGTDPRVLKLLDSAGLALTQGRLVDPPGENALELYRAVLARDPDNRVARRGIESVADDLLVQAERALMEQDLTRLASAVDAARSARPDHPRLEFFTLQLQRELDRQATPAQMHAANAAVGQALDASAAQSTAGRVQGLVQLANDRMRSNRLVDGKDSAHAYLLAARKLDPADPGVQQGVASLSTQLQRNAQQAIRESRLDEASNWLLNAVALDVNQTEIALLRSDLEAARLGNVRADRARLLVLANQRIAQGRLIEPAGDSAKHYVDLLRAADPGFEGLTDTTALLATRALTEARQHIAAGNPERADQMLQTAAVNGAPDSEIAAVTAEIASARVAKPKPAASRPPTAVMPENSLRRTRFVPPEYPARALSRGTEGWVDIEFTVAADGTTRDAVVRAAEPAEVFDRAALQAVGRWRYEPRTIDGVVVDQRVEARVRFQLKE